MGHVDITGNRRATASPLATVRQAMITGCSHERSPTRSVWYQLWYHTYVEKTTVYLPSDLKAAVKHAAQQRGVSEADVIRESIRALVGGTKPRPRGGLYSSSEPIARRTDEFLDGFGDR